MRKEYLLTPGPTPVPPEALLAMAKPIIHHRTPQYRAIFKEVNEDLKYVFQTKGDVFTFASSGTGAMEASVVNLLSAGDKAITVEGGKFGERWTELCKAYGAQPIVIKVENGKAVDPNAIGDALSKDENIKAVFTTLCETSTGVVNDIKAIAEATAKTKAVLVVDAISGLGSCELKTDEWGVDCVVCGSQKGLMIPPGLGLISVSEKAWKLIEVSSLPKYYFDLKAAKKAIKDDDTPYTPAISLVIALREALKLIKQEGLAQVIARHKKLAEATRRGMLALGLKLFSESPSDAVTAVIMPQGVDGEKFVKTLRDKYGVSIAGGQSELKGKIFRIAHLGYMNEFDVIVGVSAIEIALAEFGYKLTLGAGVKAAEEALISR